MFKKLLGLIMYYSTCPSKNFIVFKIHIKEISLVYSLMSMLMTILWLHIPL